MPHQRTVPPEHYLGLDLAPPGEVSALAVLEAQDDLWSLRLLQRWPRGTSYPRIIEDLRDLLKRSRIASPTLVIDGTAVGSSVVKLFREAGLDAALWSARITAGATATREGGTWHLPRRELASCLQAALQTGRLRIARDVPHVQLLQEEMLRFQLRPPTLGAEGAEPWREREGDDLVLAVALAAWAAERSGPRDVGIPMVLGHLPDRAGLWWTTGG